MSKTGQNLQNAFAGESQANRRYLAFAQKAEVEGYSQVAKLFRAAAEAETVHAALYQKALESLGQNAATDYYVCQVCGFTAESEAPDDCPVCKAKRSAFRKVA
jgi:rubrerythrin